MKDREPDLSLRSQTIAYLEVDSSEAERLTSMPTMVTGYNWGPIDGTYILPPILYPDGKYYLKVRPSSLIFQPECILYETMWYEKKLINFYYSFLSCLLHRTTGFR
jgi:hypothetical protein